MAPTELECPYKTSEAGCPYKTQKLEFADAKEMMQMHTSLSHQAAPVCEGRPQAERVKRPVLTLTGQSITQDEFEHFLYLFSQYKGHLGTGHNTATLLRECLAEDVSKVLFSSHGSLEANEGANLKHGRNLILVILHIEKHNTTEIIEN